MSLTSKCFVRNCFSTEQVFSPCIDDPVNVQIWIDTLPRRERPFDPEVDKVCLLHFNKSMLKHKLVLMISGASTCLPVTNSDGPWSLVPGAYPSIFEDDVSVKLEKLDERDTVEVKIEKVEHKADIPYPDQYSGISRQSQSQVLEEFRASACEFADANSDTSGFIVKSEILDDSSDDDVIILESSSTIPPKLIEIPKKEIIEAGPEVQSRSHQSKPSLKTPKSKRSKSCKRKRKDGNESTLVPAPLLVSPVPPSVPTNTCNGADNKGHTKEIRCGSGATSSSIRKTPSSNMLTRSRSRSCSTKSLRNREIPVEQSTVQNLFRIPPMSGHRKRSRKSDRPESENGRISPLLSGSDPTSALISAPTPVPIPAATPGPSPKRAPILDRTTIGTQTEELQASPPPPSSCNDKGENPHMTSSVQSDTTEPLAPPKILPSLPRDKSRSRSRSSPGPSLGRSKGLSTKSALTETERETETRSVKKIHKVHASTSPIRTFSSLLTSSVRTTASTTDSCNYDSGTVTSTSSSTNTTQNFTLADINMPSGYFHNGMVMPLPFFRLNDVPILSTYSASFHPSQSQGASQIQTDYSQPATRTPTLAAPATTVVCERNLSIPVSTIEPSVSQGENFIAFKSKSSSNSCVNGEINKSNSSCSQPNNAPVSEKLRRNKYFTSSLTDRRHKSVPPLQRVTPRILKQPPRPKSKQLPISVDIFDLDDDSDSDGPALKNVDSQSSSSLPKSGFHKLPLVYCSGTSSASGSDLNSVNSYPSTSGGNKCRKPVQQIKQGNRNGSPNKLFLDTSSELEDCGDEDADTLEGSGKETVNLQSPLTFCDLITLYGFKSLIRLPEKWSMDLIKRGTHKWIRISETGIVRNCGTAVDDDVDLVHRERVLKIQEDLRFEIFVRGRNMTSVLNPTNEQLKSVHGLQELINSLCDISICPGLQGFDIVPSNVLTSMGRKTEEKVWFAAGCMVESATNSTLCAQCLRFRSTLLTFKDIFSKLGP